MENRKFKDLLSVIEYAKQQVKSSDGDIQVLGYTSGQDQLHDLEVLSASIKADYERETAAEFIQHLNNTMKLSQFDAAGFKLFEEAKWTIEFNGKKITILNCAAIFNGVYDALKEICE